jgi:hypothetical protein
VYFYIAINQIENMYFSRELIFLYFIPQKLISRVTSSFGNFSRLLAKPRSIISDLSSPYYVGSKLTKFSRSFFDSDVSFFSQFFSLSFREMPSEGIVMKFREYRIS